MSSSDALLASYPRQRPPISAAHQEIFVDEYKKNRTGGGLYSVVRALASWSHRMIARKGGHKSVLELGAGSLNHLPYEPDATAYDVVEPFEQLYEDSPNLGRVRELYADIDDVPLTARYDRIISKAVLEHLTDLPKITARAALHLDDGGVYQHGIPSEGGFLWGLAWRLTTGVAYRLRTGLDYKSIIRHEHVNTAPEIIAVVRHFFEDVRVWHWPLPIFHLSFYTYLEASSPRVQRCREYLGSVGDGVVGGV